MKKKNSNVLNVFILFVVVIAAGIVYKKYQHKKQIESSVFPPPQDSYILKSDSGLKDNQSMQHNIDVNGQNVNIAIDTTK